jgi:hypothetical protein
LDRFSAEALSSEIQNDMFFCQYFEHPASARHCMDEKKRIFPGQLEGCPLAVQIYPANSITYNFDYLNAQSEK